MADQQVSAQKELAVANLPLAFAEMIGGGIILLAGISGESIGNVVRGQFTIQPLVTGGSTATSGAAPSATTVTGTTDASGGGSTSGISGTTSLIPSNVISEVHSVAASHGWGPSEIAAWLQVILRESGGSLTAQNPTSNAYGIAQFINGPSEYATYGGDSTTVSGQITAMANYIEQRYGSPSAALNMENTNGYY